MIKKKNEMDRKIHIDLTGPDGNAFVLIGIARNLAKQMYKAGCPKFEWLHTNNETFSELFDMKKTTAEEFITQELMKSDYEELLEKMEYYFGDFIIMYR